MLIREIRVEPLSSPRNYAFHFSVWIYPWTVRNSLQEFQQQLTGGVSLTDVQAVTAVEELVREDISAEVKADFLTALAKKGETVEVIAAFAQALRDKSILPPLDAETRSREILDVCGTGGDHLKTFNISTTVALVVAAAGVTVAKHGNRAITSQSGSADVLEALGIRVDLSPEEAAVSLRDHHFAFLFAPKYHPAFKHLALARRLCAQRGQRTIFNLLGPLLNPARPTAQLIGVPRPEFCEPLARVLQTLGIRRGMVVSGKIPKDANDPQSADAYLDELSIFGENFIAEFFQERGFSCSTLLPENFGIQAGKLSDLAGGDAKENAEITRRILRGDERGPKRDAVLLNAAAALFVANKVKSMGDGWSLAEQTIDSGQATLKIKALADR
ncbi:MAG: Anthranilate phosphoribosyltransferase [Verrucomicrobiales bacterium]|nr:Anthranilate phosphoribosyltransferase [Verrucomicrobiales bacterium]